MQKVPIPVWSVKCQKKMINPKVSRKELAKQLHVNYATLSSVMTGRLIRDDIAQQICGYFGVER